MKKKILHLFCACFLFTHFVNAAKTPNIVFIIADDLGITDIAAYAGHYTGRAPGDLYYETPHLDKLVNNGIAFSQAYANQLCSPTRAAIMTGQYPARHGFTTATPHTRTYYNQGMEAPKGYVPHDVLEHKDPIKEEQAWINGITNTALDPNLPTLPKVLKSHRSIFIGKWHLGGHGAEGFQPADHGFEPLAWLDAGASFYIDKGGKGPYHWKHGWNNKKLPHPNMPQKEFTVGYAGEPPHEDYLTNDLSKRVVNFIGQYAKDKKRGKEKRPFFLYVNHFAVHTPLEAPEEDVAYFRGKPQKGVLGHEHPVYAAMVKRLDDAVGRVMKALKDHGLEEDTLIVFTSDNGGVEYTNPPATDNAPFKGGKATLYEGGVRVPLVYYWPNRYEGGIWCDQPVNCTDHLPTLADLTHNRAPSDLDGESLVALLENPALEAKPRTFIWHYPFNVIVKHPDNGLPLTPHSGIRIGDHKLIWDWHGKLELYNILKDPFEVNNLASRMPEKRDNMFRELKMWLKENVAEHYFPTLNPDYDSSKDKRLYPFKDYR